MIKFRDKTEFITLYHATSRSLLPKILKEGLKVSSKEQGKMRERRDGIPPGSATGILYLARNINSLPIDPRLPRFRGELVLLEISVPREVYDSWDKDIDPVYKYYKTKKDWIIATKKGKYTKEFEREIREETGDWRGDFWKTVYPKSYDYKMTDQEIDVWDKSKSLVIRNNIPPDYIKIKK